MNNMTTIQILKNGQPIREFRCTEELLQKAFAKAHSIAGGLWNGVDTFSVKINK